MGPGSRIGRFEVVETLGQGGIATVYRVRHSQLHTLHALKILKVSHTGLAQRLLQEGRIQAQLHHPNVVAVTDVIEEHGQIGLLMELVDGFSLEDCLVGEPMDMNEALDIFRQVLEGVAAAHAAGVTHRDLKPGNILLTTRGDRVLAKVTDFGIAKVFSEEGTPSMTRVGATMGTPGYMAPEQMRNSAGVDHRADIFALGAILYEMLSGRPAFREDDMLASLTRVAQGRYTPVEDLVPTVAPNIARAIARALQPDLDDRFQDCAAFAHAIYGEGLALPEPSSAVITQGSQGSTKLGPAPTLAPSQLDEDLLDSAFSGGADLGLAAQDFNEPVQDDNSTYPERILPADFFTRVYDEPSATSSSGTLDLDIDHDEEVDDEPTEDVLTDAGPAALPDLLSRSERGERLVGQDDSDDGAVDPMNAEDAADTFRELIGGLVEATLWALARVLRYGAFPLLAFVVFSWWVSVRASYRLEQLAAREKAAEASLRTSMDASASLVPGMVQKGADEGPLMSSRSRYQQAVDLGAKMNAAKELSSVMSVQLSRMPPAETMADREERRRVELALARIDQDLLAYDAAAEAHTDEAGSLAGRMAELFGMVEG